MTYHHSIVLYLISAPSSLVNGSAPSASPISVDDPVLSLCRSLFSTSCSCVDVDSLSPMAMLLLLVVRVAISCILGNSLLDTRLRSCVVREVKSKGEGVLKEEEASER
jgi:hypothetical protein